MSTLKKNSLTVFFIYSLEALENIFLQECRDLKIVEAFLLFGLAAQL